MRYEFSWRWLPDEHLDETLALTDAAKRIVGGFIRWHRSEIEFVAGDLVTRFLVPFSWFEPTGDGVAADFEQLAFDDYGDTISLGEYEVASRSVLRDFDTQGRGV